MNEFNVRMTNVKTGEHVSIGEVQRVEFVNGEIIVTDCFSVSHKFPAEVWDCVCYAGPVKCCHCGGEFYYNSEFCTVYRGEFLCSDCFQDHYGYCNECGELNKYEDMNDDIVCKGCDL